MGGERVLGQGLDSACLTSPHVAWACRPGASRLGGMSLLAALSGGWAACCVGQSQGCCGEGPFQGGLLPREAVKTRTTHRGPGVASLASQPHPLSRSGSVPDRGAPVRSPHAVPGVAAALPFTPLCAHLPPYALTWGLGETPPAEASGTVLQVWPLWSVKPWLAMGRGLVCRRWCGAGGNVVAVPGWTQSNWPSWRQGDGQ